jgi:hypothetical protein
MKRLVSTIVVLAAVVTLYASRTALAQPLETFKDRCPPDRSYEVQSGSSFNIVGPTGLIDPCGFSLTVDVTNAQGKLMMFGSQWATLPIFSPDLCNSAGHGYAVYRPVGGNVYTLVGYGHMLGYWANWFGSEFCLFRVEKGEEVTRIANSPYNDYRLYIYNCIEEYGEGHGCFAHLDIAAGFIAADPRFPIE